MSGISRINNGFALIVLTLGLLVLTCLQASGSILTRNLALFNQSRSYSIFFLRTFSEIAGLSLSATISATLERINWVMICRHSQSRARFVDFLALQQSTTVLGLLSLAAGASMPSVKTRLMVVIRLICMVLVPGIGILIMSQVDIQLAFSPVSSGTQYFGYDIQPMNASTAKEFIGFIELMVSWKSGSFLGDPTRSIDLTPKSEGANVCGLNEDAQDQSGCNRTFFLPMESVLVVPDLVSNSSFPDADIILASDHRGYLLNFTTGDSTAEFNAMSECRTYSSRLWGFQIGAIRLCVGNTSPNELEARLLTCPISIAIQQMCLNDTSWNYNVDWTAKMSVFFQNSAVAYSRSNGTILWHSFAATPAIPVNISSSQILEAYDNWLFDTTTLLHKNGTALPLFSSSTVAFWLWATEPEFNGQNAVNPAESNGIFAILQSLLVMPLYYCQNGMMMRLIQGNFKSFSNPDLAGLHSLLSATPERSSPASFANYRYESIVSYPSIIAYIILSGIAVLACSVALVVIKVYADRTSQGRGMPRLSRFPALDLFAHCTVEDENRCVIYQGRSGIFPTDTSQRSLRSWLSTISIKWSKPLSAEDDLPLFALDFTHDQDYSSSASASSVFQCRSQSKTTLFDSRG